MELKYIAVICIGPYLNVHESIKKYFPNFDLFQCDESPQNIQSLIQKLNSTYNTILITNHQIIYNEGNIKNLQFFPLDYIGGDYYSIPFTTSPELYLRTFNDPKAVAFNTKGYIKSFIEETKLVKNNYLDGGGIYLYRENNDLSNFKIYLPSELITIIPKFTNISNFHIIPSSKKLKIALLLRGYLDFYKFFKEHLHNIVHSDNEYFTFISCYENEAENTNNKVTQDIIKQELSNLKIFECDINASPDPQKLFNEWFSFTGETIDIVLKISLDMIVDKPIKYHELHKNTLYENEGFVMYYNKYYQNNTEEYHCRSLDTYNSSYTLVTCLFDINREYWPFYSKKAQDYITQLEKSIQSDINLCVYLDKKYIHKFSNTSKNIKIIPYEFEELYGNKFYNKIQYTLGSDFFSSFIKHLGDTKLPQFHHTEYNVLLNSKVDLLYRTTQKNPFNSQYFVWVDLNEINIPSNYGPLCSQYQDKISIGHNHSLNNLQKTLQTFFKDGQDVLQTNTFAGSRLAISKLHQVYYETLDECLDKNIINHDKYIMSVCYKNIPDLFKVYNVNNDIIQNNIFKVLNNYKIGIFLFNAINNNNISIYINRLKKMGHYVDTYSIDLYKNSISLPDVNFAENIDNLKTKVKDQCFNNGKYDCILLINNFFDDDKINFKDIKYCVKNNTICIRNNVIYGSYDVMINSQFN